MCYTYDSLSRVTARTVKKLSDNSVVSTETFSYDAAGNVTSAPDSSFQYDTNNRLISFNGNTVSYDLDGNMLSNGSLTCTYDSANRLVSAGGHTYTYTAEDVRIRNLCGETETTYVYDTNARLSRLLVKNTDGVITKYVYGRGLVGEETNNQFKTYHFDYRGSTVALTDINGTITDTFEYDTYGKLISRTGNSSVIFLYNGRDGVVTDSNGLFYMRARYYSPTLRRFINADIIAGEITNAVTLNRYAYANGNPVSNVDPFGLSAERTASDSQSFDLEAFFTILFESLGDIETAAIMNTLWWSVRKILNPSVTSDIDPIGVAASLAVGVYILLPEKARIALVEKLSGITMEEHYGRLALDDNMNFPKKFDATYYEKWNDSVGAACHQFTSPNQSNRKYVSSDGKYEVIYDENNNLVEDAEDVGTYNFTPSTQDSWGHFQKDVLPWIFWGNSSEDTTTIDDRLNAFIVDGTQEAVANWLTNLFQ